MILLSQLLVVQRTGLVLLGPLSFKVPDGENLYVVGESGSGKSTLLEVITGLCQHMVLGLAFARESWGEAEEDEEADAGPDGASVLLAVQDAQLAFSPYRRVWPQLLDGMPAGFDTAILESRVEELGVSPTTLRKAWPHELSGGMLKRALLAAVLAGDADLVLFDEPTAGIDASWRWTVLDSIKRHCTRFILATHDLDMVRAATSGHLLVLDRGTKAAFGPVGEVLASAGSGPLARLLGTAGEGGQA